ncbi:MAG: efflux transporter outer membrane subunit [Deltaproteobacteria bacterium]|nr:efflux transporter outer membrane subunit [Deltaproteobacteria bacterium]
MVVLSKKTAILSAIGVLLAAMSIGGCATVGPDYIAPAVAVPALWHAELKDGLTTRDNQEANRLAEWWTTLNDPVLSGLIDRAVKGNLDIKKAQARLRESRARRGVSEATLFPTLDASGSVTKSGTGDKNGGGQEKELYSVAFDAGWEIDLFGRIRRSVEAAEADFQASQEDLRNVLVSLTAEVALNYIELRTYQTRLAVAEANLKIQQETYELTRMRFQAGLDDELSVLQARYTLENTRSQAPVLRISLEESRNRIAVLLGVQPGVLHAELAKPQPVSVTPLEIAVGVPADLLRRRPDVRKAERELAAQTARIGVATADLYPKITLSGSIGLEALSIGSLFSAGSGFYSFGPRIAWPIFDAGAIRNNIKVQSALQEQALIQYESTVLQALEEVENALVAYAEGQRRRSALNESAAAAQKAFEFARTKYRAGLIDFMDVLETERSLVSYQDQLAQGDGNIASSLVRLYKALGGGWKPLEYGAATDPMS